MSSYDNIKDTNAFKFAFDITGPSMFTMGDGRSRRAHEKSQEAKATRQRTIARTGRDPADFVGVSVKSDAEIAKRKAERAIKRAAAR